MQEILRKVTKTLKDEGIASVGKKARSYIKTKNIEKKLKTSQVFQDVLFINGCGPEVPHPAHYGSVRRRFQSNFYHWTGHQQDTDQISYRLKPAAYLSIEIHTA